MKKTVTMFAVVLTAVLSALAELPVAQVAPLTPVQLAAWNAAGIPITDISGAYAAHTTGCGWSYKPYVCTYQADFGYIFKADSEQISNEYDAWYADYVVSFDEDIPKESLGLVGEYPSWGSLGFFAPVCVPKGRQIALLNSVMRINNWTYADVRSGVVAFTCGAFNLAEENVGKKMKVELRIFAPNMSTTQISDPTTWQLGVNTYIIHTETWTVGEPGVLPANDEHGPLVCNGIATNNIPPGNYYLDNDKRKFVKLGESESVSVGELTAYFTERHTVCQIGNVGYETLEEAFAAAQDGDTITLTEPNTETFGAASVKLFLVNTNGCAFTASNITPYDGCEFVQNLDGTYTYRMKVEVKDMVTKNVVETKVEDESESAAVAITDENFNQLFPTEGAKTLEIIASGVGTVSFDPEAVTKIGQNITNIITEAGGYEAGATTKTTVTVAIADVTAEVKAQAETPKVIIVEDKPQEVVQAISVTAILRTIVKQAQSEVAVTNEEVYAAAKAAGISTVTVPYSGIKPQVWYIDTESTPWTTNAMTTAYNADAKELSFKVSHFSDYVITDAETYAMVGVEKFRTLQEAFDWVETNKTQGTTVTLTKDIKLSGAATLATNVVAALDFNGKTISWADGATKTAGLIANDGGILTMTNGTLDAGTDALFTTGSASAKTYITGGIYKGNFPNPTGLATNAGPILVSGGVFSKPIPAAFCAPGYVPGDEYDEDVGGYHVKNAEIYIRNIGACQRYPWNGYVDIDFDVCWDEDVGTAKLYVSAWDLTGASPKQIKMKNATLVEENVPGSRDVDCETGFNVTAPEKKHLHLIWNSAEEGVPTGTKCDKVGFKFLAK